MPHLLVIGGSSIPGLLVMVLAILQQSTSLAWAALLSAVALIILYFTQFKLYFFSKCNRISPTNRLVCNVYRTKSLVPYCSIRMCVLYVYSVYCMWYLSVFLCLRSSLWTECTQFHVFLIAIAVETNSAALAVQWHHRRRIHLTVLRPHRPTLSAHCPLTTVTWV